MSPSRISYSFLGSFLVWTFFCEKSGIDSTSLSVFIPIGIMFVAGCACLITNTLRAIGVMMLAIGFGALLSSSVVSWQAHVTDATSVESFANDRTVLITGWIADAPEQRPTDARYTIETETIETICKKTKNQKTVAPGCDGTPYAGPVHGKLLATGFTWPPLRYGDPITVSGKLTRPGIIEDFDYGKYLSLRGIFATMTRASIARPQADPPTRPASWKIFRKLYDTRTWYETQVQQVFVEPQAALLLGLLTGAQSGLPQHLADDFRTAGLSHIVAVSGYNVTIVLLILSGLLCWLPVRRRILPLAIALMAYGILTGGSPPVMRAVIMGILGLIAITLGRQSTPRLTVLWTAFVMVLMRPQAISDDVSFQLSFLAVIGLMELSPWLQSVLKYIPDTLGVRTSLAATLAALIMTLPLTIFIFRQISLVAPITNVLVAPLIPLAMLTGFIATVAGILWLPLGLALGYPAWAVLELIILIAETGARVPWAAVKF
ncbi:MAG: ComEC/Rec2 family competence protein [Candidatus Peribacteraceae bacterium]|nr:ComEC/Rec2 family competence protein [Candidatus Peribacteraceae bacterium]